MYWRPLPSRAPRPSENSILRRPSTPPASVSTRSGAQQHHPGADTVGRCHRGFPVLAQLGQESGAGRCGLVDGSATGVAVVTDGAGIDEHSDAGLRDRRGQHLGRPDAAVTQALLERARPSLVADVDAAQVHHGVDPRQCTGIEFAGVRIPEHLVGVGRRAAHDPQHPAIGRPQGIHQCGTDQAGGSGDRYDGIGHDRRQSFPVFTGPDRPRTHHLRDDA